MNRINTGTQYLQNSLLDKEKYSIFFTQYLVTHFLDSKFLDLFFSSKVNTCILRTPCQSVNFFVIKWKFLNIYCHKKGSFKNFFCLLYTWVVTQDIQTHIKGEDNFFSLSQDLIAIALGRYCKFLMKHKELLQA